MGAFFCKHSIKSATSQFFLKRQGTLARPLGNNPRRLFWRVLWRSVFQTHLLCLAYPRAAPPVTVAALRSAFQAPQWNTAVRRVNWAGLGNGSAASRIAGRTGYSSYMAVTWRLHAGRGISWKQTKRSMVQMGVTDCPICRICGETLKPPPPFSSSERSTSKKKCNTITTFGKRRKSKT